MITSELPLAHPPRLTISCMTEAMLGVCWSGPASPVVVRGGGDHDAAAPVLGRDDVFPLRGFDRRLIDGGIGGVGVCGAVVVGHR